LARLAFWPRFGELSVGLKQDKINLMSYLPYNKKLILPWQKKQLVYKFKFLELIGNEYQGKQIKIWFNFEAEQEK
jgi:hypothetical protein